VIQQLRQLRDGMADAVGENSLQLLAAERLHYDMSAAGESCRASG
jgi:hypothetical protein